VLTEFSAQKLKQAWVQNAKIKSKWKAEKRKAGIAVPRPVEGQEDVAADGIESDKAPEPSVRAPTPTPSPPPKKRARDKKPQLEPAEAESSNAPSLRDRAREAYSQASLHTYRSDPFSKKQRGGKAGTTGCGQPNMKMRMNVLLETIKRDFT
jgi:hypothetical protein